MVRINEDDQTFYWKDFQNNRWEKIGERTLGGSGLYIVATQNGARIDIKSELMRAQCVMLADMGNEHVIGRIEVTTEGALAFHAGPSRVLTSQELPWFWKRQSSLVLGIKQPASLNVRDVQGRDEDVFRYKAGHTKWFIPKKYKRKTKDYDTLYLSEANQFATEATAAGDSESSIDSDGTMNTARSNANAASTSGAKPMPRQNRTSSRASSSLDSDDDSANDATVTNRMPGLEKPPYIPETE